MIDISLVALGVSLAPIALVVWIARRWTGKSVEVIYASARMLVQLLAVGFVLVFVLASNNPWIGVGVVVVMIGVSSLIGIRTVTRDRRAAFLRASAGIGLGGGAVLAFVLFAVLRVGDPWYQPRILIPIAGMVFSNAMTAVTLAAERFERELDTGASYEEARAAGWNTALIPQINALLAVGLVSLPGMMTGQILAGVDPLLAVRYQIVVMGMVLQSAAFAVALFLWLAKPKAAPPPP